MIVGGGRGGRGGLGLLIGVVVFVGDVVLVVVVVFVVVVVAGRFFFQAHLSSAVAGEVSAYSSMFSGT